MRAHRQSSDSPVAYVAIVGGIIGAGAAAIPGFIDFWSLRAEAFKVVLTHMATNLLALLVFVMSLLSRSIAAPYRAGKTLSLSRRRQLERAKKILQEKRAKRKK